MIKLRRGGRAAVDGTDVAVEELRRVGGEVHHRARDLDRPAVALHGDGGGDRGHHLFAAHARLAVARVLYRRVDVARADHVDPDVLVGGLERHAFGHVDHRRLRAAVGAHPGVALQARVGAHVDDRARALFEHLAHAGARHVEGAEQVCPHDPFKILVGGLDQRRGHHDACVVEQDIDPAEGIHGVGHDLVAGRRVGDVGQQQRRPAAGGLDPGFQRFAPLRVAPDECDGCAVGGELARGLGAQPRGRAGDQRDLVGEGARLEDVFHDRGLSRGGQ